MPGLEGDMKEMTENYVRIAPSDSGFAKRLVNEIRSMEKELTDEQELYIITNGLRFRIEWIKHNLDFVCIRGSDSSGQCLEVVCHECSFSGVLAPLPKRVPEEPPVRIGFRPDVECLE